jgi:hypothetical protein
LNSLHLFIIRALLGGVFAVILSRMFYPGAGVIYVIGLAVILVGLAYVPSISGSEEPGTSIVFRSLNR